MKLKENSGKTVRFAQRILSLIMVFMVVFGSMVPVAVSAATDTSLYAEFDFENPVSGTFTTKGANQKTYKLQGAAMHNPRGIDGYGVSMTQQVKGSAITENVDYTFNSGHSIAMWVRGDVLASGWSGALIAKGAKTKGHFDIAVKDKIFHIYGPDINGNNPVSLGLNCSELTNDWHHIAFVWEGNVIKSYVDGVLKATSSAISGAVEQTSNPISIGACNDNSLAFTGIIDEVKLYTKALGATEVTTLAEEYEISYVEMSGDSEVGNKITASEFCLADGTAVQFWFNAKTFTQNTSFETLFSKGTKDAKGYFQFYTRNGNLEFHAVNQDSTKSALSNTNYMKVCLSEFTGGWHMFTVVNKDSKFLTYIDDTLISTVDSSSYKPSATAADITIGALDSAVFTGSIKDFELLITAPDAAAVKKTYDDVVASLVNPLYAELDFEDPVSGTFTTKGANKKTYTLGGKAVHNARGIDGYGMSTNLQAAGAAITEKVDYTFNSGHSISMWIHGDMLVPGTKSLPNVLLAKGPKASGHFEFYVKGPGGNAFYMYAPDVGDIALNLNVSELYNGWHHLAFVWENDVILSYVDGVKKATSASISSSKVITQVSNPISIGAMNDNTLPFLNGIIDEVQLYTKALSAGEVVALASAFEKPKAVELKDKNEVGEKITASEFCLADGTAVQFWFNAESFTNKQKAADVFETLFSKGTKGAKGYFQLYARNGLLEFHAVNQDDTSSVLTNANYMKVCLSEFTSGWHMFTLVNKDSKFLIYIDDTLISTVDSSSYKPSATAADITIGALGSAVFSGKIQMFELLTTAPDAAAVKATYKAITEGISTHTHTPGEWKIQVDSTCSSIGYKYNECTKAGCGVIIAVETIPTKDHTVDTTVFAYDGSSHWNECKCGYRTNAAKHTMGDWSEVLPATPTSNGADMRSCACGYNEYRETAIETNVAHTHVASDWITDASATCTSVGYKHKECTDCKAVLEIAVIEKAEHAPLGDYYYNADSHWKECACGYKYNAVAHSFGEWKNFGGEQTRSCACGYYETKISDGKDHTHSAGEWITKTEATCNAVGYRYKKCTTASCGAIVAMESIAPKAHDYETALSYDILGHFNKCKVCGDRSKESAHSFGEWKFEADGKTESRSCACGYKETRAAGAASHNHVAGEWIVDIEPTCTSAGYRHKECSYEACGEILEFEAIAAKAHVYSEEYSFNSVAHWNSCECGKTGDKEAHSLGEWTVSKEESGAEERSCACGYKEVRYNGTSGEGLSKGAAVGISIAATAVVSSGIAISVLWFLTKKRIF